MRQITRPICPRPDKLVRDYKFADNKNALISASNGKCCYCESKVLDVSFGDIEHIKPKSIFSDLEFEWSNLGLVCSRCNNEKRDKYVETIPYINPYEEDPSAHIVALGAFLMFIDSSERGKVTLDDIKLNRKDLIESRSERLRMLTLCLDACNSIPDPAQRQLFISEIIRESHPDCEYSMCVESMLKNRGYI